MRGRLAALALAAGLTLTGCGAQENGVPPEFIPEEGERLVVYLSLIHIWTGRRWCSTPRWN